jgi:hypothetical protein
MGVGVRVVVPEGLARELRRRRVRVWQSRSTGDLWVSLADAERISQDRYLARGWWIELRAAVTSALRAAR